mmetsp:Transcript_3415/g.6362  ORF Transcript_3415/g.6362 Transcript_3415/m.6362 type:complete len:384 (-) Transcript_3415:2576-3727(-)
MHLNAAGDAETVEHLVLLEETSANVQVNVRGHVVDHDREPLVQAVGLLAFLQALAEESLVELQRVLVHRIDQGKLGDDEVDDTAPGGDAPVALPSLRDLSPGHLRVGQPDLDGRTGLLTLVKGVDQVLVVQNISGRIGEHVKNLVLDLLQRLLISGDAHDELRVPLLEIGALVVDDVHEQLVLQAAHRHREVDDGSLDADLGHVVRVGELGGDVKLEVEIVRDVAVSKVDHHLSAPLEYLLHEHGLQTGVELLLDVLEQNRVAVSDGVLKSPQEIFLSQLDDEQIVVRAHLPDPPIRLALGINHERPASAHRGEHTVLGGELVGWEAENLPVSDRHGRAHNRLKGEALIDGNVLGFASRNPLLPHLLPVLGGEGPKVGEHAGT